MTREMKNSGVEWIGDIPSEWKVENLQWNMNEIIEKNSPIKITSVLSLTKEKGVIPYEDKGNQGNKSKESIEDYKIAYKGTIVANSMNILIGSVGISNYDGCVSPVYYVFKNNNKTDLRFLNYIFTTEQFQKQLRKYANGILEIRLRVSSENIMKQKVMFPPLSEQKKIADFLDSKVTEIDKIISETKASIENYKEYKQSVITEAVTKGLDKNVPMKDSGIEWIGEIPVDWRLGKIKSCVTKVGSGKTPKGGGDVYSSEGVLFLRSQNVYDTGLVLDDPTYISEEIDEEMKNTRVMDKDVLLNITGGSIGRCCIYDKSYGKANVNQHVSIIRLKQDIMFPEYMHYYWLSSLGKMSVNLYQTGGNREGMSADAIKNSPIIYTSISTQKEIIAFLDSKCAEIDNIILEKEKLITNLEEYKKSLIYEYVTGKKVV